MLKVFGLILLVISFFVYPAYPLGFYSLKPKSFYMKILERGLLPFNNETGELTQEIPENLPVLVGILVAGGIKKAILFFPKERKKKEVVEGEELNGGFTVKLINKNLIVLSKGRREYKLEMFSEEAKKTRDKRKRVAYIPSSRKNVQGVTSTSVAHGSLEAKPSKKAKKLVRKGPNKIEFPKEKKKPSVVKTKKVKSFIDIIKSLSQKKRKTHRSATNPFLELFKKK